MAAASLLPQGYADVLMR